MKAAPFLNKVRLIAAEAQEQLELTAPATDLAHAVAPQRAAHLLGRHHGLNDG
jgi:hypothetical protein